MQSSGLKRKTQDETELSQANKKQNSLHGPPEETSESVIIVGSDYDSDSAHRPKNDDIISIIEPKPYNFQQDPADDYIQKRKQHLANLSAQQFNSFNNITLDNNYDHNWKLNLMNPWRPPKPFGHFTQPPCWVHQYQDARQCLRVPNGYQIGSIQSQIRNSIYTFQQPYSPRSKDRMTYQRSRFQTLVTSVTNAQIVKQHFGNKNEEKLTKMQLQAFLKEHFIDYKKSELKKSLIDRATTVMMDKKYYTEENVLYHISYAMTLNDHVQLTKWLSYKHKNITKPRITNYNPIIELLQIKNLNQNDYTNMCKILMENQVDVNVAYTPPLPHSALTMACALKNYPLSKLLIQNVANVNFKTEQGFTPLAISCIHNNVQLARLLIEYKADVDASTKAKVTPLMFAVQHKDALDLCHLLIDNKVDVNAIQEKKLSVLGTAVTAGNNDVVTLLLEKNADPNRGRGSFPLHIAVQNGSIGLCRDLVAHKANIDLQDEFGYTPLAYAVRGENYEIARYLIKKGAQLNLRNVNGEHLMHQITKSEWKEKQQQLNLIEKLVKVNISIDLVDELGNTPLMNAISHRLPYLAKWLILAGADLSLKQKCTGFTALMLAAQNLQIDTCKLLLKKGVCIDQQDDNGDTVLLQVLSRFQCGRQGVQQLVDLFLEKGVNVDLQNIQGNTAIIRAAKTNIGIQKQLCEHGADLNIKNFAGLNPLLISAQQHNQHMCEYYVSKNADPNVTLEGGRTFLTFLFKSYTLGGNVSVELLNLLKEKGYNFELREKSGENALDIAIDYGLKPYVIEFLIKQSKDVNASTNSQEPLLIKVIKNLRCSCSIFDLLLSMGADVDGKNAANESCLMVACRAGKPDMCYKLIDMGANLNAVCNNGQSALHHSFIRKRFGVCKYLMDKGIDTNIVSKDGLTVLNLAIQQQNLTLTKELIAKSKDMGMLLLLSQSKGLEDSLYKNLYFRKLFVDLSVAKLTQTTPSLKMQYPSLFYNQIGDLKSKLEESREGRAVLFYSCNNMISKMKNYEKTDGPLYQATRQREVLDLELCYSDCGDSQVADSDDDDYGDESDGYSQDSYHLFRRFRHGPFGMFDSYDEDEEEEEEEDEDEDVDYDGFGWDNFFNSNNNSQNNNTNADVDLNEVDNEDIPVI